MCVNERSGIAWVSGSALHACCDVRPTQPETEGGWDAISSKDIDLLQLIFLTECRKHREEFRRLAAEQFPSVASSDIVYCMDHTVFPPTCSITLLKDYTPAATDRPSHDALVAEIARDDNLFLLESIIPHGRDCYNQLHPFLSKFWEGDSSYEFGGVSI